MVQINYLNKLFNLMKTKNNHHWFYPNVLERSMFCLPVSHTFASDKLFNYLDIGTRLYFWVDPTYTAVVLSLAHQIWISKS